MRLLNYTPLIVSVVFVVVPTQDVDALHAPTSNAMSSSRRLEQDVIVETTKSTESKTDLLSGHDEDASFSEIDGDASVEFLNSTTRDATSLHLVLSNAFRTAIISASAFMSLVLALLDSDETQLWLSLGIIRALWWLKSADFSSYRYIVQRENIWKEFGPVETQLGSAVNTALILFVIGFLQHPFPPMETIALIWACFIVVRPFVVCESGIRAGEYGLQHKHREESLNAKQSLRPLPMTPFLVYSTTKIIAIFLVRNILKKDDPFARFPRLSSACGDYVALSAFVEVITAVLSLETAVGLHNEYVVRVSCDAKRRIDRYREITDDNSVLGAWKIGSFAIKEMVHQWLPLIFFFGLAFYSIENVQSGLSSISKF